MDIIYVLLPFALLLAFGGAAAFIWTVRSGQLDDLDTPSVRILSDDIANKKSSTSSKQ